MARILIAGCGYVGEAIADLFHEKGWEVEGWTASENSAAKFAAKPYRVRAVNVSEADAISSVRKNFEVVVLCASSSGGGVEEYRRVYLNGAQNLVRAFPSAPLIFTSSTSVYAQKNGEIVDEKSPANPTHEKGKILRVAEEVVRAHHGIVTRLGGIYGPGRSAYLRKFLSDEAIPLEDRFTNQIHRDDIAFAIFLLAERRLELAGEIYNVVDDSAASSREIYNWLGAKLSRPISCAGKSSAPKKRGESNKRVSNGKLRALGWSPRFPTFREAFAKSILPSFGL